jgi:hypothetical protein
MKTKLLLCRVVAGFVGIYHIMLGILLIFSGEMAINAAKSFAGMTIIASPQFGVIGEILACYFIAFGLMMGLAAWNPIKNRSLITVGLVLFVLRLLQRLIFAEKAIEVFQMSSTRYWGFFVILLVISLILGFFRVMIYRDMK